MDRLPLSVDRRQVTLDLLEAECYFHEDDKVGAMSIVRQITRKAINSTKEAEFIVSSLATIYESSHPIRSMILLHLLSKIILVNHRPNDAVSAICYQSARICIGIIQNSSNLGNHGGKIEAEVGILFMSEMLKDIEDVKGADNDWKMKMISICHGDISSGYLSSGEPLKAIEHGKAGLEIMQRQFGSEAEIYSIYGILFRTLGVCDEILGNYAKAEEFYVKAIKALKKANDYGSKADIQKNVARITERLQQIRDKTKI